MNHIALSELPDLAQMRPRSCALCSAYTCERMKVFQTTTKILSDLTMKPQNIIHFSKSIVELSKSNSSSEVFPTASPLPSTYSKIQTLFIIFIILVALVIVGAILTIIYFCIRRKRSQIYSNTGPQGDTDANRTIKVRSIYSVSTTVV